MMQQHFDIQERSTQKDGLGGILEVWGPFDTVRGYLDLSTGTDQQAGRNAITEGSSHILIIPRHSPHITADHRVRDPRTGRVYAITYADDPVGINHHTELYLTYLEGEPYGQGF